MAYPQLFKRLEKFGGKIIRDFKLPLNTAETSISIDLVQEHKAIGLDFMLVNWGTSTVSVKFDGATAIDIGGGDSFSFSDIEFCRVTIDNSGGNKIVGFIAGKKLEEF